MTRMQVRVMKETWMKQCAPELLLDPAVGEALGAIASAVLECEKARKLIDRLQDSNPAAFEAFCRSLRGPG